MEKVLEGLKQENFMFKKKFGQNFITDQNLLDAIVDDAGVTKQDYVLEIGTGAGTLTKVIAKKAKRVLTLEIDQTLKSFLNKNFENIDNIDLRFVDFMKLSSGEVNKFFGEPFKVVANLPYYITTPIIFKLMEQGFCVKSLTIMVQKEVAERIVATNNSKDYGTISAQVQAFADAKITRTVNRKMFSPIPNVDSSIVNINFKKKYDIKSAEILRKVIEVAFSMRRKTLSNCLKSKLSFDDNKIQTIFEKMNLDSKIRGEALSVEQFVELSNLIFDISSIR